MAASTSSPEIPPEDAAGPIKTGRKPALNKSNVDVNKGFTCFYRSASPFSNFFPSKFTINDVEFNCGEQYFQYKKAELFEDAAMMKAILKASEPGTQKKLGRKVADYDDQSWNSVCEEVMMGACRAKFSQDPKLKEALMETAPTTLVEAAPRDTKWGIGYGSANPKAHDPTQWRGQNLLGFILTEIRNELMNEN